MPDYRELLRVLQNKEPGRAVMFEYCFSRSIAEQLIWRRSERLWNTEPERVRTIADTAVNAGLDTAVIEFEEHEGSLPGLKYLCGSLAPGLKICGGLQKGLAERYVEGEPLELEQEKLEGFYRSMAASPEICALIIRDSFDEVQGDISKFLKAYKTFCHIVHELGKPCIWADFGNHPLSVELLKDIGFQGIHFTQAYRFPMKEFLKKYGDRYAILGDTRFSEICRAKPNDIIAYCTELYCLTKGKGYAYGTANIRGDEIPYLAYLSILSAIKRLK